MPPLGITRYLLNRASPLPCRRSAVLSRKSARYFHSPSADSRLSSVLTRLYSNSCRQKISGSVSAMKRDDPLHLIFAFAERILAEKPFHIIAQHAQRSGLAGLLVAPAQLGTEKFGDMSQAEQRGKQQQQGDRSPAHRPVKRQHDVGHIKKRSRQAQKGEPRGPARIDVRRQIGKHQRRRDQKRQHEDDRIRRRKQNARTLFLLIAYSHGSRMTARSPEASARHPASGSRTGSDASARSAFFRSRQ